MQDEHICGRCLVIKNAAISVQARFKSGAIERLPFPPTYMRALKEWVADRLAEGGVIEIDNITRAFDVISTFNGDPVCEYHLYVLAGA